MDYTADELEDLETMRVMRGRIRVVAERVIADCEHLPKATSVAEMARQMRALAAADRMIVSLYSPPPRRRRRRPKSQPSAASENLLPCSEAYGRGAEQVKPEAERVEAEGAASNTTSCPVSSAVPEAELADFNCVAVKTVNATVRRCAQWASFWPDGARFNSSEANWKKHALTSGFALPVDDLDIDPEHWLNSEILNRVNLSTAYSAKHKGTWPDGTAFTGLIDYFSISTNLSKGLDHRATNELPGPPGLPWWIVRKPPP